MPRDASARDIARTLGVSPASVSRAFQPGSPMAEETRARILKEARRQGYLPPGQRLAGRSSSGTVTVIAGDLENPFYPHVVALMARAFDAVGLRVVLHPLAEGGAAEQVTREVLSLRSDAVILTSVMLSSDLAETCRRHGVPLLLFNRVQADAAMTAVTCDNYGGAAMVARRFLAAGRQRIGMLGGLRGASTQSERRRGFVDLLDAAGRPLFRETFGRFSYASGLDAAQALFDAGPPPDALFCGNDVMAMAAIDAARRRGLRIPDDLAIVGFDDIPMAAWAAYDLTTVRQPVNLMVADTVDLIQLLISDPAAAGNTRIAKVKLTCRGSG